ncbi:hypothetical protein WJX73_003483 [Symbiochloris irregularis]|uniref:RNA helicase n=1 Tax=Symbiochloris irregularis TaxID=706552 RepID=A0AAW1NM33_9CHLO
MSAEPQSSLEHSRQQRRKLPVYAVRKQLLSLIASTRCLVLVAETGGGKTTQVPQLLLDNGERGCTVGQEVGYAIRFDDASSAATRIKYVTDGMLLREALLDPLLRRYKVVILDEAHERTVQTDVLLGMLKALLKAREGGLKLVVMSATLDVHKFSAYLDDCKLAFVQGRQFPVEVLYTPAPEPSYVDAALAAIWQLHAQEGPGDVLVFLTGQEEIQAVQQLLKPARPAKRARLASGDAMSRQQQQHSEQEDGGLYVVPLYAALPPDRQARVFKPAPKGKRKVVLATNIAETSITVPGVRFVIDTGFVKMRMYSAARGSDSLQVVPVSRAQASQRSGRAGREAPGKAFRLYTESSAEALAQTTPPEILRTNLATVVLQMKAFGIDDVLAFDFLDRPPTAALARALEQLLALGALNAQGGLTEGVGRALSRLPVEPPQGAILLAGARQGCLPHALAVVAMASTDPVLISDRGMSSSDKTALLVGRRRYSAGSGDHATACNLFQAFVKLQPGEQKRWCRLFFHAAMLQPDGSFRMVASGQTVSIHPSSVLCGTRPQCIVFDELLHTSRAYARTVSRIEPSWLPEIAPAFFARRAPPAQ